MKCFIRSLLGKEASLKEGGEMCEPLPPLVRSLVGGVLFLSLMLIYLLSTAS